MKLRVFIAIILPNNLTYELSEHSIAMAGCDKHRQINWLNTENYHLKMAFLGEI